MNNVADPSSIKYQVKAKINADGVVDKPDVVGAIFGQTEGLLGDNLDLRDLQKSGRIGRVEVEIVSKAGKSEGIVYMSSSLDQVETAIIAATLETIDRVGPCKASIKVLGIEDVRATKREQIAERAKELLAVLMEQAKGSGSNLTQNIRESLQCEEITTYGKERCPAGPGVKSSEAIIIVEGRSDVLNLLKAGIKNAIAVEGTNIPKSVQDLSKERVTTAFVDGDRGGELILRELFQTSEIDYVARAPRAHEVEELSAKQLVKCLRNKVPGDQYMEMNGLSFEERELTEDDEPEAREPRETRAPRERRERTEHHVRRNAEDFVNTVEEPEEEPSESEEGSEETVEEPAPTYRCHRSEASEEMESRFNRSRRERRSRRNSDDDEEEGSSRFTRSRRERRSRRNSEEEEEEAPRSRFDRKRREHRRETYDDVQEETVEEPAEEKDEAPMTESVITETEDGIVVEEVEIEEPAKSEEPSETAEAEPEKTEEPVDEPKAEETVVEEPAETVEPAKSEEPSETVEAEPEKTEEPAEEEKPKRVIRAPRSRRNVKTDKILTEEQENLRDTLSEISGTRNSVLLDAEGNLIDKVEVKNLANYLKESKADNITTIVFDGVVSQNILDISSGKGIKTLVGKNKGKITKLPAELTVWTRTDLV